MRAIILYEKDNKENTYASALDMLADILDESKGQVELIGLTDNSIKKCSGCFGCWVKTPGECVINDEGNEIAKKIIKSDKCFLLTTIKFGSYSAVIKQALDRFIPLISPFFRFIDGEVHHRARYNKYPVLIPVGILANHDKKEEQLFKNVIKRNRLNFFSPQGEEVVIGAKDTIKEMKEKITNGII